MKRRERATIVGEILDVVADSQDTSETRLTRMALRVNLPYDRFTAYLRELESSGLLTLGEGPRLTAEGAELLTAYRGWRQALHLFGLGPRKPRSPTL